MMENHPKLVRFCYVRSILVGCETYFIAPTAWYYIKFLGQNELFLAFVLSAFNASALFAGPLFGRIVDRIGYPRQLFLLTCVIKVAAYILYSINTSAFFPLIGRLLSGLGEGAAAITFGQIALQTELEACTSVFVLMEGLYCLGAILGPTFGSFVTFEVTVFGWHIDQGNSPGIVLTIVWTLFLIFSVLSPKDMWVEQGSSRKKPQIASVLREDERKLIEHDSDDRKLTDEHPTDRGDFIDDLEGDRLLTESRLSGRQTLEDKGLKSDAKIEWNSPVLCLLYAIFWNEVLSSTSTFYAPVLAMNHYHLQLIHVKLLFLNCTIFTLLTFILFSFASNYFDERKLFVVCLCMQITAISLLTSIGFAWDHITNAQNYILLLYVCLGMPYFAFPFSNAILSKITDPRNASFFQGLSWAALHSAILISRVAISFVFTKESLIAYCFTLAFFWAVGLAWFSVYYKQFVATEEKKG